MMTKIKKEVWIKCLVSVALFAFHFPLFISCRSDDNVYQSRLKELLLEDMSFSYEAGSQEQVFRHEDLSAYSVAATQSWCMPSLDVSNSKLVVSVKANDTYDVRRDTVTLTDATNKATRSIVVTQARSTGLFLDKTYFEASMYGDTITTALMSNVSYEVQIPDSCDWVTKADKTSKTRGLDTTAVTFYVKENKTYKDREAIITVINKDEKLTDKLMIYQPFNTVFSADSTNFDVSMYGDTITVNLETNISYNVTIPDSCNWITRKSSPKGADPKALVFIIKENTTYHDRNGVITLSNGDAHVSIGIKVHQPFTAVLNADKKSFDVPMEGGTVTINMESNVSYDVKIPEGCDWITRPATSKTRAKQASAVVLKVAENKTYKDREAVVVIGNKDAGAEVKVTISQPFTTTFKVDNNSFDVEMEGGNVTVNLESNVSYKVSIPDSCNWITMPTASRTRQKTRATGTSAIVFRVSENTSYKERDGVVTISNKEAGAEVKIYIHQKFKTTFTVDKNEAKVAMEGGTVTANVESNIPYEVKIPSDCNWITQSGGKSRTRGTKTSVLLFNVAANATGRERSATITIGNSSMGVSVALTITQAFTTKFNVDATAIEVDELGGTLGVSVAANVDVGVQTQADWLSVGKKTDVGDGYWTQQIIVSKFTDKAAQRTGTVKFLYAAENQSVLVTVTQNRTLFIKDSSILLTEEGQKEFEYTNSKSKTVTWTSSDPNVATVVSTKDNTYTVKAVANGKAKITVKSADGKYSDTVNVVVDIPEPIPEEPEEKPEEPTDGNSGENSGDKDDVEA
jgi:uncharacterized alkaline shock family protein YloU